MAIGAAYIFNIKLPINFNSPYKALSIRDFWSRWHITLTRWLRDYLYIPLGGNRMGAGRTYFNIFVTFLLGGLWHGAGWTFVIWGAIHGTGSIIHRFWQTFTIRIPKPIAWMMTFMFVNIAWVFFRSINIEDALKVIKGMFGFSGIALPMQFEPGLRFLTTYGIEFRAIHFGSLNAIVTLIVIGLLTISLKNSIELKDRFKPVLSWQICTIVVALISLLHINRASEFLYFQF